MLRPRWLLVVFATSLCWLAPAATATAEPALCSAAAKARKTSNGASVRWVIGCPRKKKHWNDSQTRSTDNSTKARKSIPVGKHLSKAESMAFEVMCREAKEAHMSCTPAADPKKRRAVREAQVVLSSVARTLITRLQLPDPTPRFGPDPSVNEWKMAAVGYPLWLWTDAPTVVTDRVRAYGVTFTLQARWVSTSFDMGDGHQVRCTRTQPYRETVKPGAKSPVCGYTYLTSSLPKGDYTVTATTNWQITWRALGQSGSMPGSFTATRQLPVGELNALVVK